jgi:hypothetical protein
MLGGIDCQFISELVGCASLDEERVFYPGDRHGTSANF